MKKLLKTVFEKLTLFLNKWHDTNAAVKERQIDADVKKQEIERNAAQDLYQHKENMQKIQAFREYISLYEKCLIQGKEPPIAPAALLSTPKEELK